MLQSFSDFIGHEGQAVFNFNLSLINLFENWDFVLSTDGSPKLNKSAILFFLREKTGLDTHDIRKNMKKYKAEFVKIKLDILN